MTDMTNWNADDWHLLLSQHLDSRAIHPNGLATVALLIADAMDAMRVPAAAPWQEEAAEWLKAKAYLITNSLHCGDSSMTIHFTHRHAETLRSLAKEIIASVSRPNRNGES